MKTAINLPFLAKIGGRKVELNYLFSGSAYVHVAIGCVYLSAHNAKRFAAEVTPIEVKGKRGPEQFIADEHPRETSLEKLGSLKPVFKENGVVTAGNASVKGLPTVCKSL